MSQTENPAKPETKPAYPTKAAANKKAKPAAKAHVPARAVLEKLVGKKVRYVGRNAKFHDNWSSSGPSERRSSPRAATTCASRSATAHSTAA